MNNKRVDHYTIRKIRGEEMYKYGALTVFTRDISIYTKEDGNISNGHKTPPADVIVRSNCWVDMLSCKTLLLLSIVTQNE